MNRSVPGVPAAYLAMIEPSRKKQGLRVARAAWLLGLTVRQYRELASGELMPDPDLWHRMCEVFCWPRSFG